MTAHRWRVGLVATLVLVAGGLVFAEPTLLGAALVGLAFVCYGLVSGVPAEPQLRATRSLDPDVAGPGERVTVSLTVENTGDSVLPDVRIVDGVPELAVVAGSPRTATALAPGETEQLTYTVVARRGEHAFGEPIARVRSLSAAGHRTDRVAVEGAATLPCTAPKRDPLAAAVLDRVGREATADAGEGTEFHATREYRRGDPMRRIDWRHVAKTGEFVTVQYRGEGATPVVVVVDARPPARVRPAPGHPSGATLAVEAADRLLSRLDGELLAGLGLAGLEADGSLAGRDAVAWADGNRGEPSSLLRDARAALDRTDAAGAADRSGPESAGEITDPAATATGAPAGQRRAAPRPDGGPGGVAVTDGPAKAATDRHGAAERLLERLPSGAHVVLCTPALDDWAVEFGRAATDRGQLVVVSPDITAGGVGPQVAGLRRRLRLRELAGHGDVIDWNPEQPDGLAVREVV